MLTLLTMIGVAPSLRRAKASKFVFVCTDGVPPPGPAPSEKGNWKGGFSRLIIGIPPKPV